VISDNASMQDEDFATQYRALSDEAITQLASEGGLRPEADVALRAEMRKRSIGSKDVRFLRVKQKKTKLQMQAGNNPYSYRGNGLQLRGNKFLNETDKNRGITVVTRWIVLGYMSIVPIGSYRIKRSVDGKGNPQIVGKVKLQWDQVFAGWKVTALVLLAIICALLAFFWWGVSHSQITR
jgi:hypothetical protein